MSWYKKTPRVKPVKPVLPKHFSPATEKALEEAKKTGSQESNKSKD